MSDFDEFKTKWVKRYIDDMLNLSKSGSAAPNPDVDVDVVTFKNPDKTKGTLSNGNEVNTVPVGKPQSTDIGFKIDEDTYAVVKEGQRVLYEDGGTTKVYVLEPSGSTLAVNLRYVNTDTLISIPIPSDLLSKVTTDNSNWDIGFTSTGNHIVLGLIENIRDDTLKTTTGLRAHWVYYKNFSITKVSGIDTFTTRETVQGNSDLTSLFTYPTAPNITWNNNQSFNTYTGGGTLDFVLQDDPNFPENSETAHTIDFFPSFTNNYDSSTVSHNIVMDFYEYVDNFGVSQPAVDFVGSVMLYSRVSKIKRVQSLTGNATDGDTPSYSATYSGASSTRSYYMDANRIKDITVILAPSSPWAVNGGSISTAIPDQFDAKYTSGSSSVVSTNIWGVGKEAIMPDRHQDLYLSRADNGTFPTDNFVLERLGENIENFQTASGNKSVTFDYWVIGSGAPGTTGTTTTSVGNTAQSQIRYKQSTNQKSLIFYFSTKDGISGTFSDPLSTSTSFSKESYSSAFKSTTTQGIAALTRTGYISSATNRIVVFNNYLAQSGTDVESILTSGELLYSDKSITDLSVSNPNLYNNDFWKRTIDSSDTYDIIFLTIEEIAGDVVKWKWKKWGYDAFHTTFTLLKTKTTDKPASYFFFSPKRWIIK